MSANRRRHANTIPLLSLLTWIAVALFIGGAGLGYVYCKNELHRTGVETRKLEAKIKSLRAEIDSKRSSITKLSAPDQIARHLAQIDSSLRQITPDAIIRIEATELRRVSNTGNNR